MANILSVHQLSKAYTEKWLFREISFGVQKGEKVALVGANGTGKTTLLKTLAGEIEQDAGEYALAEQARTYYLPQEPRLPSGKTVKQTLYSEDNPVVKVIKEYDKAVEDPNINPDKMQFLLDEMTRLDAWDFEKKAEHTLAKLGITDLEALNDSLSGGQQKRVAIAQMLLYQPDLIIMDEPTNHLDLEAIEWLENLLKAQNITLLMVTHDRYFLDQVSNYILELEAGNLYQHKGNYTYFLEQKAKREEDLGKEVSKARNLMKKELEWMRRQPKARGTKSKSRIEAFYDIEKTAKQNVGSKDVDISVDATRLGNKVIELRNISKAYDSHELIKDFTYTFKKGDKIAIVGRNGVGKSTLLDIITEKFKPDAGSVVHGSTLKIGYYTQHVNNLDLRNRIIEEIREIADYVTLGDGREVSVSKLLDMFLFPPAFQQTPIEKLSGGEKRRLQLLKVLVTNPNFLILDEPTNDLDIDTLNVLEAFLQDFAGCLLMVSHDRYFVDKLVDHIFVFEGEGRVRDFYGNYTDYQLQLTEKPKLEKKKEVQEPVRAEKPKKEQPKKVSYKEKLEFEKLEKEVPALEEKIAKLTDELNTLDPTNYEELTKLGDTIAQAQSELEEKTERWMELANLF